MPTGDIKPPINSHNTAVLSNALVNHSVQQDQANAGYVTPNNSIGQGHVNDADGCALQPKKETDASLKHGLYW